MTETKPLPPSLCRRVLSCFGLSASSPPTLETLQQLVTHYTRIVPWESASRIARRARQAEVSRLRPSGRSLLGEPFRARQRRHLLRKQLRLFRAAALARLRRLSDDQRYGRNSRLPQRDCRLA